MFPGWKSCPSSEIRAYPRTCPEHLQMGAHRRHSIQLPESVQLTPSDSKEQRLYLQLPFGWPISLPYLQCLDSTRHVLCVNTVLFWTSVLLLIPQGAFLKLSIMPAWNVPRHSCRNRKHCLECLQWAPVQNTMPGVLNCWTPATFSLINLIRLPVMRYL